MTDESRHSGTLTQRERSLLRRHLVFYEALASGARVPNTAAQRHFVKVCGGVAEPDTQHEIAFLKYRAGATDLTFAVEDLKVWGV